MEIRLTDQNFEQEINNAKKPILVDFWALWCAPCSILGPILEKIAKEYEDKIILGKANLDAAPLTANKFGITQIPTVILFWKGKPISGFVGARPEHVIREWLAKTLKEIEEKENQKEIEPPTKEEIEALIKESQEYAQKNGLRLNPNKEVVERIIKGLLMNEKKYGFRYCPCRRIVGNPQEDKDKICPCKWHKEEIEKNGFCHCGLFTK
ncbi:thioredoxin [bacterium]|nr:thioredoxin [bacterium]